MNERAATKRAFGTVMLWVNRNWIYKVQAWKLHLMECEGSTLKPKWILVSRLSRYHSTFPSDRKTETSRDCPIWSKTDKNWKKSNLFKKKGIFLLEKSVVFMWFRGTFFTYLHYEGDITWNMKENDCAINQQRLREWFAKLLINKNLVGKCNWGSFSGYGIFERIA